jgi:fumarate reductase subunit D
MAMITKIFLFVLIFAILNVLREVVKFIKAMREEKPNMTDGRLVGLGLSVAYIITIIITGLTI